MDGAGRDVDHGHVVVAAIGDVERLAVGRDRDGVRHRAHRRLRVRRQVDGRGDRVRRGVDHAHGVARGVGHEERAPVGRQREAARVAPRGDACGDGPGRRVDDADAAAVPLGDVELRAHEHERVGQRADVARTLASELHVGPPPAVSGVDDGHFVLEIESDVECAAVAGDGEAGREDACLRVAEHDRRPLDQGAALEVVHADLVVAAGRGIDALAIRRDDHAEKKGLRRVIRNDLRDFVVRGVEQHEALHALAVVGDDEIAAVGRGRHAHRAVAHFDLHSGWREDPVVRGDPGPAGLRADAPEEARADGRVDDERACTDEKPHGDRQDDGV